MGKTSDLAAAFVKQTQQKNIQVSRPTINAFSSLFSIEELSEEERISLQNLLIDGEITGDASLDTDVDQLARITQEVKAIKKQEIILIGERVSLARNIFKKYRDKGFRQWMEMTFGSFKTGYNYLSFYDLYVDLPSPLKDLLKCMPAKAAYILASKKVPIEKKAEIVRDHSKESASSIIASIHSAFGSNLPIKNPILEIDSIIVELEKNIVRLSLSSQKIGDKQIKKLSYIIKKLQTFV